MTLDEYLETFVEGALFEDLRSMAAVTLTKSKIYGGVGYPMVTTTLAGIELLGILTSDTTFDARKGGQRFRDFWRAYLYLNRPERRPFANAIYNLVRHGLAHTYMTKPSFTVTKGHDKRHMCWLDKSVFIDALTFADELIEAYNLRVKPRLTDAAFKGQMENRYRELRRAYSKDYERMKSQLERAPIAPLSAVQIKISNVSTQGFKP